MVKAAGSLNELGCAVIEQFRFEDDRGRLGEIWTNDHTSLDTQHVYWTHCRPGVVKAWHYHNYQHDKFYCIKGSMKVMVYDIEKCIYAEIIMSEYDGKVLLIPPKIYHGFTNIGHDDAIIINCSTKPYNKKNPDEVRVRWDDPRFPNTKLWYVQNN